MTNNVDELKIELHHLFDELYGEIDYNFYFYKDEKKMLAHLFELIHKIRVDCLSLCMSHRSVKRYTTNWWIHQSP